jgi:SulP family sulfate permease
VSFTNVLSRRPSAESVRAAWLTNPKANLLAGLVVALALIPEAISFSIIAGVDPKVGLYASFSIAIIISLLFFASTNDLVHAFDYDAVKVGRVEIDLTHARIWDTSAVVALDAVVAKFAQRGISAELIGLNKHDQRIHRDASGRVSVGH